MNYDIWDFFDTHYKQIAQTLKMFEEKTGYPFAIIPEYDLKTQLVWLSIEETAYNMANELGLEV